MVTAICEDPGGRSYNGPEVAHFHLQLMFHLASVTSQPDSLTRNGRQDSSVRNSVSEDDFSSVRQTCLRDARLPDSVSPDCRRVAHLLLPTTTDASQLDHPPARWSRQISRIHVDEIPSGRCLNSVPL